jgi:hypothetical protein
LAVSKSQIVLSTKFNLPLPLDGIDRMAISAFKMAAKLRLVEGLFDVLDDRCLVSWASCSKQLNWSENF